MNESAPDPDPVLAVAMVEVLMTDPCPLLMTVGLSYTSEDPGTISLSFFDGEGGEPQVWPCGRELFAEALTVPAGDEDILLWREGEYTLVVVQRLPDPVREEYPGGRVRYEFPAAEVERFLADTYRLGPAGTATPVPRDVESGLLSHLRPE